jgi:CheY-like chemotaxis protein
VAQCPGTSSGSCVPKMVRDTPAPIVLLVQPHGDSLDLYTEYLERQGAHCIPVSSAEDALPAAPGADVVVTGILLPGSEDGIALTARLRADERPRKAAEECGAAATRNARKTARRLTSGGVAASILD